MLEKGRGKKGRDEDGVTEGWGRRGWEEEDGEVEDGEAKGQRTHFNNLASQHGVGDVWDAHDCGCLVSYSLLDVVVMLEAVCVDVFPFHVIHSINCGVLNAG